MNYSPEKYLEKLLALSGEKRVLLEDIYMLTQAQTEAINEDDMKKLELLIEHKQAKIDGINKLDEEFGEYFKRLKQNIGVGSMDEEKVTEIEGIVQFKDAIGNIMELMSEISEIEQNNNVRAKNLLSSIGEEIKRINMGRRASTVYNTAPNTNLPSYFIDKKK